MGRTYTPPELSADTKIADLVPSDTGGAELTPDTIVTCINRGRRELVDKFDGREYRIPVGHFRCKYGEAVHFQLHQGIPGSRDVHSRKQSSWIGVVNVDPPERCRPFTEEECERFGQEPEANARHSRTIVQTSDFLPSIAGGDMGPGAIDLQRDRGAANELLEEVPASENTALAEMRAHAEEVKQATPRKGGRGSKEIEVV